MTAPTKVDLAAIATIASPVIEGAGYELVDLEWKREQGAWILRLFIDRPDGPHAPGEGITLDGCAIVSQELSAVLDVAEVLPEDYSLEVGSPGIDYPLRRPADFGRVVGRKVKVKTKRPLGPPPGRRNFAGPLVELRNEDTILVDVGDRVCDVPIVEIEKANLVFEEDRGNKGANQRANKKGDKKPSPQSQANGSR